MLLWLERRWLLFHLITSFLSWRSHPRYHYHEPPTSSASPSTTSTAMDAVTSWWWMPEGYAMDGNVGEEGPKFSSIMPRRITCLYLPYPNLSNVAIISPAGHKTATHILHKLSWIQEKSLAVFLLRDSKAASFFRIPKTKPHVSQVLITRFSGMTNSSCNSHRVHVAKCGYPRLSSQETHMTSRLFAIQERS